MFGAQWFVDSPNVIHKYVCIQNTIHNDIGINWNKQGWLQWYAYFKEIKICSYFTAKIYNS